jgi:hypothetical protein
MTFPIYILPLSGCCSLFAGLLYIISLAKQTISPKGPAKTNADYIPVVYVTVASMLLYYIFLFYQSATAFMELRKAENNYGKKKTDEKPNMLKIKYGPNNYNVHVMNRTVQNYLEQIVPFLVSVFLCATFASVETATRLGWMWIFFRSYYPLAYRHFPALFLSTLPAYGCVWRGLGEAILAVSRM